MNLLSPATRALRSLPRFSSSRSPSQCLFQHRQILPASSRHFTTKRTNSTSSTEASKPRIDAISLHRIEAERRAYYKRRSYYSGAGFVFGMIAIWMIATSIDLPQKPTNLDAPDSRKDDPLVVIGRERKVVVQRLGEEPEETEDVVQTGTSTVPTFPRVLEFADTAQGKYVGSGNSEVGLVEYQLLGLGIRTVSFLGIQVYVVGMYIATDDIATLQEALIRRIDPIATTLVAGEKEKLRSVLLDGEKSEEAWNEILRSKGVRTLIRIVPTRDTDFGHMRDAFVRAVTARATKNQEEFGDELFGASVKQLKALFSKGNVGKRKEMLLARDQNGVLAVWYDDGKAPRRLGDVQDERVSRALWLNYLGGKTVASEAARKSIVEGVMEYVERPVGTVATQVHV
jgi:hypothetical protein